MSYAIRKQDPVTNPNIKGNYQTIYVELPVGKAMAETDMEYLFPKGSYGSVVTYVNGVEMRSDIVGSEETIQEPTQLMDTIIRAPKATTLTQAQIVTRYLYQTKLDILTLLSKLNTKMNLPPKDILFNDVLRGNMIAMNRTKLIKRFQAKTIKIWQTCIAGWDTFYEDGLDVRSDDRKVFIKLRNKDTNRKANLENLAMFKEDHPDYQCIYGVINGKRDEASGTELEVEYQDETYEITYMSGRVLLGYVFGNEELVEKVIELAKTTINNELQ